MTRRSLLLPFVLWCWCGSVVVAQSIPQRPEQLKFEPTSFEPIAADAAAVELPGAAAAFLVPEAALHPDLPSLVRLTLALPVGDADDPPDLIGVASMTAAMLRRGGTIDRHPEAFDLAVAELAAEIEVFGGRSRTVVALTCLPEVLPEATALLFEMLERPGFETGAVDRAHQALRSGFASRNDDPRRLLQWRWSELLHGSAHVRARQLTPERLAALTPEALGTFHRSSLLGAPIYLAASGQVDEATLRAVLSPHLRRWAQLSLVAAVAELAEVAQEPLRSQRAPRGPGFYHLAHSAPQAKIKIGAEGWTRNNWDDEDAWAARVLAEILDGRGVLSRLRSSLRSSRGLAYTVAAELEIGGPESQEPSPRQRDPGETVAAVGPRIEVLLETSPERGLEAVEAVFEVFRRLREQAVSEQELDLARQGLVDRWVLLFEDADTTAGRYVQDVLFARPHDYWSIYRERIGAVTARQVRRVARELLKAEQMRVLWVGQAPEERAIASLVRRLGLPRAETLPSLDPISLR